MPVNRIHDEDPVANRQDLINQLLDEWQNEGGLPGAPEIEIHEGGRVFGLIGKPLRLRVVWDAWEDVDPQDRASIIMDVFQQLAENPEDILRVTSVIGLTGSEARAH